MSKLLELINVTKRYGEEAALHATNFSAERGKTTVLIGPSGCGKSTLLRLIIGLIKPDSGSINFDSKPVTPATIEGLRRRIGYVIQEGGLFPHLTARGNVALMARHVGESREQMQSRLLELCELTRFSENLLRRYPRELSGGQRQRVGLMRAMKAASYKKVQLPISARGLLIHLCRNSSALNAGSRVYESHQESRKKENC